MWIFGKKTSGKEDEAIKEESAAEEKKYKIIFNRKKCIGAAACEAVLPQQWKIAADGKSGLLGSHQETDDTFVKEIGEKDFADMKLAAEGCPPNAIHIVRIETSEKII